MADPRGRGQVGGAGTGCGGDAGGGRRPWRRASSCSAPPGPPRSPGSCSHGWARTCPDRQPPPGGSVPARAALAAWPTSRRALDLDDPRDRDAFVGRARRRRTCSSTAPRRACSPTSASTTTCLRGDATPRCQSCGSAPFARRGPPGLRAGRRVPRRLGGAPRPAAPRPHLGRRSDRRAAGRAGRSATRSATPALTRRDVSARRAAAALLRERGSIVADRVAVARAGRGRRRRLRPPADQRLRRRDARRAVRGARRRARRSGRARCRVPCPWRSLLGRCRPRTSSARHRRCGRCATRAGSATCGVWCARSRSPCSRRCTATQSGSASSSRCTATSASRPTTASSPSRRRGSG